MSGIDVSAPTNYVMLDSQKVLIDKAKSCKLVGFVSELEQQFSNPLIYNNMTFDERLDKCFEEQKKYAKISRFKTLYRNSLIRYPIWTSQLNASQERGLTAEHIEILSQTDYIEKLLNVIITGPTGTGKSSLAIAAAMEAMDKGYSAKVYRLSDLLAKIDGLDDLAFIRFKESLRKIKVLVIDDYGLIKINDSQAVKLNEIADIRYMSGSTIITSQLMFKSLPEAIDPSPIRDALADRLFRHNDIYIELKGKSWRGSDKELKGNK